VPDALLLAGVFFAQERLVTHEEPMCVRADPPAETVRVSGRSEGSLGARRVCAHDPRHRWDEHDIPM
jgi:hypothetical protein